jgi:hypothetical protein
VGEDNEISIIELEQQLKDEQTRRLVSDQKRLEYMKMQSELFKLREDTDKQTEQVLVDLTRQRNLLKEYLVKLLLLRENVVLTDKELAALEKKLLKQLSGAL